MKRVTAGFALLALLGGCHSIFGKRAELEIQPIGGDKEAVAAVVALEEGKQMLRTGQFGSAIGPLRIAAGDPATLSEAHNALGVAYASLGRGDLAERFFQQAAAEMPEDPRFAANLARYYRSKEAAMARAAVSAAAPPVELAAIPEPERERLLQAGPGIVRVGVTFSSTAMTRVSPREVAVTTATPTATGSTLKGRRNPRFSAATVTPTARPAYPIRIKLSQVRSD